MSKYEFICPKKNKKISFVSYNDIINYYGFKVSISSFKIKIYKSSLQEAVNFYFKKKENLSIMDPITNKKIYFKNNKEAINYYNLNISESNFSVLIGKIGFENAIIRNIGKENKIKRKKYSIICPKSKEPKVFYGLKSIIEEYGFDISISSMSSFVRKYSIQEAVDYYYTKSLNKKYKIFDLEFNSLALSLKHYSKSKFKDKNYNYFTNIYLNEKLNFMTFEEFIISKNLDEGFICVDLNKGIFISIKDFAEDKGFSEEYVTQKLNEGFTYKDF